MWRHISNTQYLADKVRHWNIQEDKELVSFDVKSLFTSVLVQEALKAMRKRLVEDDNLKERTGFNVESYGYVEPLSSNSSVPVQGEVL